MSAPDLDDVYAALVAAQSGLAPQQATALHLRLILVLAEHIGDPATLLRLIAAARRD